MDLVALLCLVARARMGAMCADQSSVVGGSDGGPLSPGADGEWCTRVTLSLCVVTRTPVVCRLAHGSESVSYTHLTLPTTPYV